MRAFITGILAGIVFMMIIVVIKNTPKEIPPIEPPLIEQHDKPVFIFYDTDFFKWKCTSYDKIIKQEPVQGSDGRFTQSTEFEKVCVQWTLKEKVII